jgi:hypothetical protein
MPTFCEHIVLRIAAGGAQTRDGSLLQEHTYHFTPDATDAFALAYAVQNIQKNAAAASHILFNYDAILDRIEF